MSGPKSTNYRLERRLQQMIQEDLACTQEIKICSDAIKQLMIKAEAYIAEASRQLSQMGFASDRVAVDANKQNEYSSMITSIMSSLQNYHQQYTICVSKQVISPFVTASSLAEKRAKLAELRRIKSSVESTIGQIETSSSEIGRTISDRNSDIDRSISHDLQGVSFVIDTRPDSHDKADKVSSVEDEKKALYSILQQYLQEGLPAEVHQKVTQSLLELARISQPSYLKTYKAITFTKLVQEVNESKKRIAQIQQEYSELVSRYDALCEILGMPPKHYDQSMDGIQQLKNEISSLETIAADQKSRRYIAKCVDETMEEMGYRVIGSRDVAKKSGKRFHNELYSFNEGSAVNITYSSDGQITMEIGGLSHGDRLPDSDEASKLTEDMNSFCSEFKVFEAKLREKGVLVGERIQLLPPSFEYAQIINVDDYQLQVDTTVLSAFDRYSSTNEKKTMRREQ